MNKWIPRIGGIVGLALISTVGCDARAQELITNPQFCWDNPSVNAHGDPLEDLARIRLSFKPLDGQAPGTIYFDDPSLAGIPALAPGARQCVSWMEPFGPAANLFSLFTLRKLTCECSVDGRWLVTVIAISESGLASGNDPDIDDQNPTAEFMVRLQVAPGVPLNLEVLESP